LDWNCIVDKRIINTSLVILSLDDPMGWIFYQTWGLQYQFFIIVKKNINSLFIWNQDGINGNFEALTKCNLKYECLFEMQVETWYWFSYYGGKVVVSWCLRYEIEYMPLDVAKLMVWLKFQSECLVITSIVSGDDPLRHWCEIVYMSLDDHKLMVWINAIWCA
jgi:hypothetical protein